MYYSKIYHYSKFDYNQLFLSYPNYSIFAPLLFQNIKMETLEMRDRSASPFCPINLAKLSLSTRGKVKFPRREIFQLIAEYSVNF